MTIRRRTGASMTARGRCRAERPRGAERGQRRRGASQSTFGVGITAPPPRCASSTSGPRSEMSAGHAERKSNSRRTGSRSRARTATRRARPRGRRAPARGLPRSAAACTSRRARSRRHRRRPSPGRRHRRRRGSGTRPRTRPSPARERDDPGRHSRVACTGRPRAIPRSREGGVPVRIDHACEQEGVAETSRVRPTGGWLRRPRLVQRGRAPS